MPDAATLSDAALFDTAALRTVEAKAAAFFGDEFELMRRAGQAAWREALRQWPAAHRIVVVCGPGNNGGDGYVLARHAQESGRAVQVLRLPEHAPRGELARRACSDYLAAGGALVDFEGTLPDADLVIDALFGIGLARPPEAMAAELINGMNAVASVPILALDTPSGVNADTGAIAGVAVMASATIEFLLPKRGLRTGAALDHVGLLSLASLDCPEGSFHGIAPAAEKLAAVDLRRWHQPRQRDSHKGRHGRVLCIGGDHGHGGAIVLAAEAALRSGAGLVDVATRARHVPALLARRPEVMAHAIDEHPHELGALLASADVVAVGPGLGQTDWGKVLLCGALSAHKPLLIDADALNLLAMVQPGWMPGAILTPHPGEAARLLGTGISQIQGDRFGSARALCERYGCTIVLKGAGTIVVSPGFTPQVIAAGNPGMAVGGMGDVLSGVIAALLAQGLAPFDAASAGALLHAVAGDRAADERGERGLLPSDLMPWLRQCLNLRGGE